MLAYGNAGHLPRFGVAQELKSFCMRTHRNHLTWLVVGTTEDLVLSLEYLQTLRRTQKEIPSYPNRHPDIR